MSATLHFSGVRANAPGVRLRAEYRLHRAARPLSVGAMPELIRPTERLAVSFAAAVEEFIAEGRGGPDDRTLLGDLLREAGAPNGSETWIARVMAFEHRLESDPPRSFVPSTTYWWTDGDAYLGRINLRHRLNEHLSEVGGHIGYDVRPSARRRGHATAMLAAALPRAGALGIEKALITCDADNTASRMVIERNGGVLEDRRGDKLRYWAPTAPAR
jgi:predicted acetyltransferase